MKNFLDKISSIINRELPEPEPEKEKEKENNQEIYPVTFPKSILYERLQISTSIYLSDSYFKKYKDLDPELIVMDAYEEFHKQGNFSPSDSECLVEIKKATLRDINALVESDPSAPKEAGN